jgi:hypothetical protein
MRQYGLALTIVLLTVATAWATDFAPATSTVSNTQPQNVSLDNATALDDLNATPDPGPAANLCLPRTLAKGSFCGIGNEPGFLGLDVVIDSPKAWIAFWQAHTQDPTSNMPPPPVDFNREVVLATVQGPQTSAGPNIAIVGLDRHGPIVHVNIWDDERPGPLPVITNPFHFVAVHKACLSPRAGLAFVHFAPEPDAGVVMGHIGQHTSAAVPAPLPNAHVSLIPNNAAQQVRHTRSGFDGSYFFVNVPPGDYLLKAEKADFEAQTATISVPAGARVGQDLYLVPLPPQPGAVQGVTLQPAASGPVPLGGVKVQLLEPNGVVMEIVSGNNGEYAFVDVDPGPYLIRGSKDGFRPTAKNIIVRPGETLNVPLLLRPAPDPQTGAFGGTVVTPVPNGQQPVGGALVSIALSNTEVVQKQTNNVGQFFFGQLPPGQYPAMAEKDGFAPDSTMIDIIAGEVAEFDFVLIPNSPTPEP